FNSKLGHRQLIEKFLDDRFAGLFFSFGLVSDGDPMTQHIHADALYVLRSHIAASPQERVGLGAERQSDRRTRRSAELDHTLKLNFILAGVPRGADKVHDVVLHFFVDVDLVDDLASLKDLLRINYRRGFGW